MAGRKQANFLLSEEVLEELRKSVAKREQSQFVETALQKELKRVKLQTVLETGFGAWKEKDHPELEGGTDKFVRELRKTTRPGRKK